MTYESMFDIIMNYRTYVLDSGVLWVNRQLRQLAVSDMFVKPEMAIIMNRALNIYEKERGRAR